MITLEDKPIPSAEFSQKEQFDAEMKRIDELLVKLKGFETDRPYGTSDRVDQGIELLNDFLAPSKEWFLGNNILLIYHGSLQYHDPINLDIDATFVFQDRKQAEENFGRILQFEKVEEEISNWPARSCVSNFAYYSIQELEDAAEQYERPEDVGMLNQHLYADGTNYSDERATEILSSRCFFPEQEELFKGYQERARQLLLDPNRSKLRQGVIENLEDIEKTREERREALKESRKYSMNDYWT